MWVLALYNLDNNEDVCKEWLKIGFQNGDYLLINFFVDKLKYSLDGLQLVLCAVNGGQIEIVRRMWEVGFPFNHIVYSLAAQEGIVSVIHFLFKKGVTWAHCDGFSLAAVNGKICTMDYILTIGWPIDRNTALQRIAKHIDKYSNSEKLPEHKINKWRKALLGREWINCHINFQKNFHGNSDLPLIIKPPLITATQLKKMVVDMQCVLLSSDDDSEETVDMDEVWEDGDYYGYPVPEINHNFSGGLNNKH